MSRRTGEEFPRFVRERQRESVIVAIFAENFSTPRCREMLSDKEVGNRFPLKFHRTSELRHLVLKLHRLSIGFRQGKQGKSPIDNSKEYKNVTSRFKVSSVTSIVN